MTEWKVQKVDTSGCYRPKTLFYWRHTIIFLYVGFKQEMNEFSGQKARLSLFCAEQINERPSCCSRVSRINYLSSLPRHSWHVEISQIYAELDTADSIPNILTLDKNHKNVKKLIFYRGCPTPEQAARGCINRQLDWGGHHSLEQPHSHSQTPGPRVLTAWSLVWVFTLTSDGVRDY